MVTYLTEYYEPSGWSGGRGDVDQLAIILSQQKTVKLHRVHVSVVS